MALLSESRNFFFGRLVPPFFGLVVIVNATVIGKTCHGITMDGILAGTTRVKLKWAYNFSIFFLWRC